MEIFKQVVPALARVAILSDSDIPGADASGLAPIERANAEAARSAGLMPQILKVRGPAPDLEAAFKAMASEGAQALVILEVPVTIPLRKRIAELAALHRIPTMFWGGASDAGGVFTYGTSFTDTFAGVPAAIDKILKGARPADMPFELVTRRVFVIDINAANALGLTIPSDLLKGADRVIK
jgi:putative ABC transport system substrate-binding protein